MEISIRNEYKKLLFQKRYIILFVMHKTIHVDIPITEINHANSAIRVNLYPRRFHIVRFVSLVGEIGEIEVYLVPAGIEAERHRRAKVMDLVRLLKVAHAESPMHVPVVEDLWE